MRYNVALDTIQAIYYVLSAVNLCNLGRVDDNASKVPSLHFLRCTNSLYGKVTLLTGIFLHDKLHDDELFSCDYSYYLNL